MRGLGFIFDYLGRYKKTAFFGAGIKVVATFLLLLLPFILEHLVDNIVPQKVLWKVLLWGGIMVLTAFVERILNRYSSRLAVKTARDSIFDMREDLFASAIELSGSQVDAYGLPSLTSRLTVDAYSVQGFMQLLLTFAFRAPTLVIGCTLITLIMEPRLGLILLAAAVIMIVIIVIISMKGIPLYGMVQQKVDNATRILRENFTGVRVVKALIREEHEKQRFDDANEELMNREKKAGYIMSLPSPLTTLVLNIGLVLVVLLGAILVNNGVTRPGMILAFLTYFNFLLMGVLGLNRIFMMMSRANASALRIRQVIREQDVLPVKNTDPEKQSDGSQPYIRFEHVSFSYNNSKNFSSENFAGEEKMQTVSDIDFSIRKGGTLGIIGSTGSGKTTLVNLLMRFYDPDQGRVLIEGKDIRSIDKAELRKVFGTVFQNDMIFADSIRENIAFGREVSDEDILKAARASLADEFVSRYEDGYEHKVAARGSDISGGQKQRILIARALAGNADIIILDDSSSALDYKTDAAMRHNIAKQYAGTTCIIIAQRISSLMDADEILFLDGGRIAARGTHEELLTLSPVYKEIYETQMGDV